MNNKKGFTLIEVLIALSILSMSILTFTIAFKQFVTYKNKLENEKEMYNTVLSIIDYLLDKNLILDLSGKGKINNINYSYKARIIKEAFDSSSYSYEMNNLEKINKGLFKIYLLRVDLNIGKKSYTFYKVEYLKEKPG